MVLALVATTALSPFLPWLWPVVWDRQSMGYLSGGIARMNYRFVVATIVTWFMAGQHQNQVRVFDMVQHKDASFMVHMGDITETGALSGTTSSTVRCGAALQGVRDHGKPRGKVAGPNRVPFRVPPWRRQLLV